MASIVLQLCCCSGYIHGNGCCCICCLCFLDSLMAGCAIAFACARKSNMSISGNSSWEIVDSLFIRLLTTSSLKPICYMYILWLQIHSVNCGCKYMLRESLQDFFICFHEESHLEGSKRAFHKTLFAIMRFTTALHCPRRWNNYQMMIAQMSLRFHHVWECVWSINHYGPRLVWWCNKAIDADQWAW